MTEKGADFGDLQPRDSGGVVRALSFVELLSAHAGLFTGQIFQVTPNNVFRLGQQIIFFLGVANPLSQTGQWISRLRLKLWWARPNMEFRQAFGGNGTPGSIGDHPIDTAAFGSGANVNPATDNRYVWVPSCKRLDVTEFQTPPPPAAVARTSDSLILDDVWTLDLQDPNDATYVNKFGPLQLPARWVSILYPAMGYALGFTYEATYGNGNVPAVGNPLISLNWHVGTFDGAARIQESVG